MKQIATLLLMCDGHDVGLSINAGAPVAGAACPQTEPADGDTPRIFIYDAYPGGIGFSEPLFSMQAELLDRTRQLIAELPL